MPVGGNDALSAGAGYPDATAPAGGVGPLAGAGYADATAPVGGTDALAAYARDHGADLILLPADLEEPGLAERLKGETVDNAVEEANESAAGLAVVLVAPDGATELATGRL